MAVTLPRIFTPALRDLSEPDASWGHDFAWFCRSILLDPLSDWQEWLGIHSLEVLTKDHAVEFALLEDDPTEELAKIERLYSAPEVRGGRAIPNGRLRFQKITILISRQNGKTDFVKKLLKWAIYRKRLPEVMAAAQTLNKSMGLWREILREVARHPKLKKLSGEILKLNGSQEYWTKGYVSRYRPVGINEDAGRGDTIDLLYLDEVRTQRNFVGVDALESTTTVPDNGLIVMTSSAGSWHSVVLRQYRDFAIKPIEDGTWRDTRLGIFEWSADPKASIDDEEQWKQANPDLGNGRISIATLRGYRAGKSKNSFRTEHLCVWVEDLDEEEFKPLWPLDLWNSFAVHRPVRIGQCVLAIEVSPDGESVSVVSAGRTRRGAHVQTVESGEFNVDKTVSAVRLFTRLYDPAMILVDPNTPAAALITALIKAGIEPVQLSGGKVSMALRTFERFVSDKKLTHDGNAAWEDSLRVAEKRGEDKKFPSIERFSGEVSTLVAGTFAVWGLETYLAESGSVFKEVDVVDENPAGAALPLAVGGRW